MLGLVVVILLLVFAVMGPVISKYSYSDQELSMANISSIITIHDLGESEVYLHTDYKLYSVVDGVIIER